MNAVEWYDEEEEARWPRGPFLISWLVGCAAAGALYQLITMSLSAGFGVALLTFIIPFGPVLAILGAVVAALPLLVLTGILTLLGSFWQPARRWPLWAGTAAAGALMFGPWLDSGFIDPLPDLRDTVAVLIPAMGGASTSWVLLRQPSTRFGRELRSVLVATVLAILLLWAALYWRTLYARQHVQEVRWASGQTFRPSNDHVAAPVTLLEYPGPRGGSRYWTTGRSLTFRWAPAYLRPRPTANGPLRELRIRARRGDFAPLRAGPDAAPDDLDVALSTVGTILPDGGADARNHLRREPEDALGTMCGLRFVYDGYSPDEREAIRRGWPASYAVLKPSTSAVIAAPSDAVTGARCGSGGCSVSFRYRGFAGSYRLAQKDVCRWPEETRRVVAFLNDHLIAATPPRPMPTPVLPGDGIVIDPVTFPQPNAAAP